MNVFTVDIGSPSGKDGTEGDILRMEFQTQAGTAYLPSGTYELMENDHLWTNLYAPYKMTRGYFDEVGGRTGTRYEHFARDRYNVVDTFAFVYSGRVGVEQLAGEEYKFNIELADGHGFLIQTEWSGPMELCYDPSTSIDDVVANGGLLLSFVDDRTLAINAALDGEKVRLYSVDGQLLLTTDKNIVDVSQLASGIYVVKVGNKLTTKIVKK